MIGPLAFLAYFGLAVVFFVAVWLGVRWLTAFFPWWRRK